MEKTNRQIELNSDVDFFYIKEMKSGEIKKIKISDPSEEELKETFAWVIQLVTNFFEEKNSGTISNDSEFQVWLAEIDASGQIPKHRELLKSFKTQLEKDVASISSKMLEI